MKSQQRQINVVNAKFVQKKLTPQPIDSLPPLELSELNAIQIVSVSSFNNKKHLFTFYINDKERVHHEEGCSHLSTRDTA